MKVLYIGGTGEISFACVNRSLELGHDVTVFNRGLRGESVSADVEQITGDLRDDEIYRQLAARDFEVVCQFLVYDTGSVQRDVDFFAGHCAQYVFISSAAAYRKPHHDGLVTEDVPLTNPYWVYGRSKAACEALLTRATLDGQLPATIVRPSHTYRTRLPSTVVDGDHLAWRMLQDKPVIVHDDGETFWTLTHADDFAQAFARLLGNPQAIGSAYHITSDEAPTWKRIIEEVGETLGKRPKIHGVPSTTLVGYKSAWEGPLLGDKSNSMRFDNSSIRGLIGDWRCEVTLHEGLQRVWPRVQQRLEAGYQPDPELDALIDRIIANSSH